MEKEAACRSGWAGGGAGEDGYDFWDFFGFETTSADVEHGSDQVADHVVQEAIPANAVDEEIAGFGLALVPGGGEDGADGTPLSRFEDSREIAGGQVGVGGGKAQEVVFAFEKLC
jgi:hypothetical protein